MESLVVFVLSFIFFFFTYHLCFLVASSLFVSPKKTSANAQPNTAADIRNAWGIETPTNTTQEY